MKIRQYTEIRHTNNDEHREITLESILELEEQYRRGEISTHSYFAKKRALIKML